MPVAPLKGLIGVVVELGIAIVIGGPEEWLRSTPVLPPYTHLGDVEEIFNPLGVSLGASES
jgi:hypothetical protein